MRQLFRPHSITYTFMTYLLFLSVLPLTVVGVTAYQTARNLLQEEANQYTRELIINEGRYLDLQLEQVESLLANISGVEEIRESLKNETPQTDTFTSLATQARIGYILNGYSNLDGLVSIDIFTVHDAHYHVGDTLNVENIRTDVRDALFAKGLTSDAFITWTGVEENVNANSTHKKVVTAVKILYHMNPETLQQEPQALFLINYSIEMLHQHFSDIQLGEGAYLLVLDSENRYIYHPDPTRLGTTAAPELTAQLAADTGAFFAVVDDEEMNINYTHSAKSSWIVMSLVPRRTLIAKTAPIGQATALVFLLSLGIIIVSALFFNRNVVAPIQQITARFQQLQHGDSESQAHLPVRGKDELAELTRWFNAFLDSLAARREAELQIQTSLREKDVLLKEIHHRVKNNLQIVSSLFNLELSNQSDPQMQHVFLDSQNRVRSMALIHEKLYQSQNLARIDFAEYARHLAAYLLRAYHVMSNRIELHIVAEAVYLGVDTAVPCGLILNELISNAIQHAFPDQRTGKITVELYALPHNTLSLRVSDDGIGLSAKQYAQNHRSLGLQLVNTLVNQLHGTLELAVQSGEPGTTFYIIFQTA